MLQFTPPINNPICGTRLITNVKTGTAVDNAGMTTQGSEVMQWGANGGRHSTALDDLGGSTVNRKQMIQRVAPTPLARAVRWQQPTAI